jgi:hypothetical protein
MQKARSVAKILLVAILFGFGVFCGVKFSRPTAAPSRMFDTPAILKQVQSLSELVTVKYVMEKTEVWNDPPQSILAQFFAGDNRVLLLAHGVVKAGVDLSQIKPEDFEVREKTVRIKLPPANVTDAYLDDSQTKVVERKTGFLRSFDKDLEQNIRHDAIDDIRRAAIRGGIREDADLRAHEVLVNLFRQLGFEKVEFDSRVKDVKRENVKRD